MIDKFNKGAGRLASQPVDYWDQFEDVLDTTAENKWNNQIHVDANLIGSWRVMPELNHHEMCLLSILKVMNA